MQLINLPFVLVASLASCVCSDTISSAGFAVADYLTNASIQHGSSTPPHRSLRAAPSSSMAASHRRLSTFANIYEAEEADTLSGVVNRTSNAGYSGSGYADYNSQQGSYVEFNNVDGGSTGGECILSFRYALRPPRPTRPKSVTVNGVNVGTLDIMSTGSWTTWQLESLKAANCLAGPNNVIRVTAATSDGGANLDYMEVIDPVSYYKV